MPSKAQIYVACVATVGLSMLAAGLVVGPFPDPPRYACYLLLGLLASTLKLRLPGLTGTMSVNFLFILMGIADYSFAETIVMGCGAAIVQSVWRPKRRPEPIQVVFNVAALAISISVAYGGSRLILSAARAISLPALLALAACLFFVTNTGLVSLVLSFVEEKPLRDVWRQCYFLAFPYYLIGAGVAGLVSFTGRAAGWKVSFLVLPVMYLTYLWYRFHLENVTRAQSQGPGEDHRAEMVVSSRES